MANNDKGTWIKLYRDIQYNWLWQIKPFSKAQAWIDLILLAHHADGPFSSSEGEVIDGKRGYVYRSIQSLADRWGWDRKKVTRFLTQLETENMVKISKKQGSKRTSIAIVNYSKFQSERSTKRTTEGQEEGQLKDKRFPIDKNGNKNGKNEDKNGKESVSPVSPKGDPASTSDGKDDIIVDFGAMTDEEFERWMRERHESRDI